MSTKALELKNLTKRIGDKILVNDVTLSIKHGETFSFLGPIDSGIFSLWKILLLEEKPTEGEIRYDKSLGVEMIDSLGKVPDIGRLSKISFFSKMSLFPTKNVFQNISLPLELRKTPKDEIEQRVKWVTNILEIDRLINFYPHQVSGRLQERIALAQALVTEPELIFLDEPLSKLGKFQPKFLQTIIKDSPKKGITVIYRSNTPQEAISDSDRVAVFNRGRVEQIGTPLDIFENPATPFVREFIPKEVFASHLTSGISYPVSAFKKSTDNKIEQLRYVNVNFARHHDQSILPKRISLQMDSNYYLRVDIGSLSTISIVENALESPFPSQLLPRTDFGHWLEVIAVSYNFSIQKSRYNLFLPKHGSSWVCGCELGKSHVCDHGNRSSYLFILIRTPKTPGDAIIRLGIYYRKNLLQSQHITAEIVHKEKDGAGSGSWIDYSLSAGLADLSLFPVQTLNILTNRNDDKTHSIIINDDRVGLEHFRLTEGQISEAQDAIRKALYNIHIEEKRGSWLSKPKRKNRYNQHNAKSKEDFISDIQQLAMDGWALLDALVDGDRGRRGRVKQRFKKAAKIQIARTRRSEFIFPWSLVYDIEISSRRKDHTICKLLDEWDGKSILVHSSWSQCPYEGEHGTNTICPFGFWGFRHMIEQPPNVPENRDLAVIIRVENTPPELIIGLSEKLNKKLKMAHIDAIKSRVSKFSVNDFDTLDELKVAMGKSRLEFLYFYCHGRREAKAGYSMRVPALVVGEDEEITPPDIATWCDGIWPKDHWLDTAPLVFINGCHTTELTPKELLNFVDAFVGAYASGVLGTEIPLHQQLANEAAEQFLIHFQNKETVGEALKKMRTHLLQKGNLLGLAYTPFCSAELKLQ